MAEEKFWLPEFAGKRVAVGLQGDNGGRCWPGKRKWGAICWLAARSCKVRATSRVSQQI